jgi:hypothetical protein
VPVQAVERDANSSAPTTTSNLTTPVFYQTQVGNGPCNCIHMPINSSCILCDHESILHAFLLSSQNEQDNTETKEDLDLLPCLLAIVKYIQQRSSSVHE